MIGILDLDLGNLQSVTNALHHVGAEARVIDRPEQLDGHDKLILPGVGAFGSAMETLRARGFEAPLRRAVLEAGTPLLAICLGMQLLLDSSEEGGRHQGLGFVPGRVVPFRGAVPEALRVPHVGWNTVSGEAADPLVLPDGEPAEFYFVHGYYCIVEDPEATVHRCEYGIGFDAAFVRRNVHACQFHPEKSLRAGLGVLRRFAEL